MSLESLYALIADDMHSVDAVIRARLDSDVVLVRQVAEYIIAGGGKRMRPMLTLASARLLAISLGIAAVSFILGLVIRVFFNISV